MAATIQFKTKKEKESTWVSFYDFEMLLAEVKNNIFKNKKSLTIVIQARANASINTLIRLLSVANQLSEMGVQVTLNFSGLTNRLLGYCKTIGFFSNLSDKVAIKSSKNVEMTRRAKSSGTSYISINKISGDVFDKELPDKLATKITKNIPNINETQRNDIHIQFRTLFGELTNNVCQHSQTELNGFAALQIYKNRAEIVVCDSGIGLLESLRPTLTKHNSEFEGYSDTELVLAMLTQGISCKGRDEGGNGLMTCFLHAKRTNSDMHIRLEDTYYHFYRVAEKTNLVESLKVSDNLLALSGTFISFAVPY